MSTLLRLLELSRRQVQAWRPTGPRMRALLRSMLTSYVALAITFYILPGRQSSGPLAVLGLVVVVAVVGGLLRPVLSGLAVLFGPLALLLIGMLSQAIIVAVALVLAPEVDFTSWTEVLLVACLAAFVAAVVNWLFDAGSEDSFLNQLLGRAVRVAHRQRDSPATQGLLIVQFDGVGRDVLAQALRAGQLPTLSRWLRSGTHTLSGWHTGLPSTTPAGQAVLLHGDVTEVPGFRWFEKETGHLVVANHPRDAAEIEHRISDGAGLLSAAGVSVSNLFSGDAPTCLLTMSDARLPARTARGLAALATTRSGLVRSSIVFIGQVFAELIQGRRQRHRDVQPRVQRGTVFALQRGVTTALLRDLSVAIVAEQIARSAPVIFVDFLDYDEMAHHAGPTRPESMRCLDQLDRLVGFFADVVRETGHHYEIAILSDHGQAQGATFEQLCGSALHDVIAGLAELTVQDPTAPLQVRPLVHAGSGPAERWGSTNVLLAPSPAGGPDVSRSGTPPATPELVVAAAGSMAHVYLADLPGLVSREMIDRRYPLLIAGLARHPQIGAVAVYSQSSKAWTAVGAHGWRTLTEAGPVRGEGPDPVAGYGPQAAGDLWSLTRRNHVGDLIVLGRLDPVSDEVAAFEALVGSHGGLGGGQTEAVFLHPSSWPVDVSRTLSGSDLHDLLQSRIRGLDSKPVR